MKRLIVAVAFVSIAAGLLSQTKRPAPPPVASEAEDPDPPPPFIATPLATPIPPGQYLPRDPGAVLVLPNVRVNQDVGTAAQNETTISVNPTANDFYVGGANDYSAPGGRARCGAYRSTDSAQTWTGQLLPLQPTYTDGGDPAVAYDSLGNVYFACMNFTRLASGAPNTSAMYVFKSIDNGLTYGAPALVASGLTPADFHDKEYIATDHFNNKVYMSWTYFGPGTSRIQFAGSNNGGATFAAPAPVVISDPANTLNQGSVPANGNVADQVYVAWMNFNTTRILIDKSNNGGASFNALGGDVTVANITPLPANLPGQFGSFRVNSSPTLDVCRNHSSPFDGHVYVAWADNRNGDGDILFSKSVNGGATWSAPKRINDDALGNRKDQFFPWISVDESCKINIAFYDRRDDPANLRFHVYFTHSTDDGVTFVPNVRVTTAPSTNAQFLGGFIGDYIGLTSTIASSNTYHHMVPRAVPMWMDTRNGDQDAFAATLLQINNAANLDLKLGGTQSADNLEILIPGNVAGRVIVFLTGVFHTVTQTYNAGTNQTTVALTNPTPPITPGTTTHIGLDVRNVPNPQMIQVVWTSGSLPISAPPVSTFDLKWNPATKQFSVAVCNDRLDAQPLHVTSMQFAIVDLPLQAEQLIQDPVDLLTPALAVQGAHLSPLPFPATPITQGQCKIVAVPSPVEQFQAVVLKGVESFQTGDSTNHYAQGLAKASEICDVNRDGQVDRLDIQTILDHRNTVAPLGFPSNAQGVVDVNVGRVCTLKCDKPSCQI